MRKIIYIPFDHLHRDYGALKNSNPETDVIAMVESRRMTTGRNWHPARLHFLISSARHFAQSLREEGFLVEYLHSATTIDGLSLIKNKYPGLEIECAEPSSFTQFDALKKYGVRFVPNDFFLTPRPLFSEWANNQKNFLMENFYKKQRQRLNILMEGSQPVGGAWNFDKENRLPPPKNYAWPQYKEYVRDDIDLQLSQELGYELPTVWATSRSGALEQLNHFIEFHFAGFGPLEDAMTTESWSLHHSLLSPYLNNGLLHPSEVIAAAISAFETGKIPLESCEGFIRQIIGWREYINGMYWYFGQEYRTKNQLNAHRNLLPLFVDAGTTQMNCMKETVNDIHERAWVHHIPRLMLLSNLALLAGVNPVQFLDWMRENFIDAAEWVMVPNVIGMGLHADGGQMMTKPYAAGGAYISRMSNYCNNCIYDPKLRVGESACPYTTLYWDFINRHKEVFASNLRMRQQVFGLARLSDLPELKSRAEAVLAGLEKGEI